MPLLQTSGNVTADGYGGGVAAVPQYIEDVFSTWLYTGNNGSQTITNNIDLSTKGGMVWIKNRQTAADHDVTDTVRGARKPIFTNSTAGQDTNVDYAVNSFLTTGFTLNSSDVLVNALNQIYASWTFRKQPKFFDVVTYSGSNSTQTISHNLGSTPGCIIIKKLDSNLFNAGWSVYHRSLSNPSNYYLELNTTAAEANYGGAYISSVNSSTFTIAGGAGGISIAGSTYVAYLFAHNAGGFGLTGTDNVISCGSFSVPDQGPEATVTLGYEPQWIMVKRTNGTSNWIIFDTMRGWRVGAASTDPDDEALWANLSNAANPNAGGGYPTATGFVYPPAGAGDATYIYIAIRRGPMKVPTSGTSVFSAQTGTYSTGDSLSVGFPADMYIDAWRTGTLYKANYSRLVNFANSNSSASQNYLKTNTIDAEVTTSQAPSLYDLWNTTAKVGSWNQGVSEVWWMFKRAPSFFDEVCFTQSDYTQAYTHNLTVVPEMMIVKRRNNTSDWSVYSAALGNTKYLKLQDTGGQFTGGVWGNTSPTSTQFTFSGAGSPNTYVAYLFATCAGVSKVGSYTGTGTTQQVNCGFTGGARFVLIKRTDDGGDWYVWDSARGIVSGNDPYLLLNSTAAEVTNTDYVDTYSAGFEISSTAPAAINASGGTFIFLAIA